MKSRILIVLLIIAIDTFGQVKMDKKGCLNEPFLEWEIINDEFSGNPYDVIALATFTHLNTGIEKKSLMYYSGDNTWKFRFTGTILGEWEFTTTGPGKLNGFKGNVLIEVNPEKRKGFLTAKGTKWCWTGSQEEHIPQLVMGKRPGAFWSKSGADTKKMDDDVREFIIETGFTGFHLPNVAVQWFDITSNSSDTRDIGPDAEPDPRSFLIIEEFIMRAYRAGASTHIWLWGADSYKVGWGGRHGPGGIGGPMSGTDKRLNRYIAARLGPIPGWSMGYGFDLEAYIDAGELQEWYEFLKGYLYNWEHLIGGRGDEKDTWDRKADPDGDGYVGVIFRNEMQSGPQDIFWTGGDYIGLYDYRVPYLWYRKSLEFAKPRNKPVLQEDRFRIRTSKDWFPKDYSPDLTRRGLWHSMMAGGVGNIWGNELPIAINSGSQYYNNNQKGSIQDVVDFKVDIKDEIKLWNDFWFKNGHFKTNYIIANELTNYRLGVTIWDTSPTGGYITVALRSPEYNNFIFYTESASEVKMDLSMMKDSKPALILNVITGEKRRIDLKAQIYKSYDLEKTSDWIIAVGEF